MFNFQKIHVGNYYFSVENSFRSYENGQNGQNGKKTRWKKIVQQLARAHFKDRNLYFHIFKFIHFENRGIKL